MMNQFVDANKNVLDPCSGSRMFYFDRANANVIYADSRRETHTLCDGRILNVCPDEIVDYRCLPYEDAAFNHVVFDPPHLVYAGKNSWLARKYGTLDRNTWREEITAAFAECWRVLANGGTMIFKWNEDTAARCAALCACRAAVRAYHNAQSAHALVRVL